MKPFWLGFQLTLGVIVACIAIPALVLLWALALRYPQVLSILLAPALVGIIAVVLNAARKLKHL